MPKIKFKNIPEATIDRICDCHIRCTGCPLYDSKEHYHCMRDPRNKIKDIHIELSEKDFPTNSEWLESLSDEDLAKVIACGELPINPDSFGMSVSMIKEWFSQLCKYLMEDE